MNSRREFGETEVVAVADGWRALVDDRVVVYMERESEVNGKV